MRRPGAGSGRGDGEKGTDAGEIREGPGRGWQTRGAGWSEARGAARRLAVVFGSERDDFRSSRCLGVMSCGMAGSDVPGCQAPGSRVPVWAAPPAEDASSLP